MSRGFRICTGNFQSVLRYKKGNDQKPPITRHFYSQSPFDIYILNPLDMRIHRDPSYLGQKCTQKCLETNTFQVLGNCGSFSKGWGPLTSELFPLRSSDHDCCWDTLLKTLHQSRQEINGKCKCKQTSNEYRQTPPNT